MTSVVPPGRLHCMGNCGSGEMCRDLTYQMGYCVEPRIRAKLISGEPIMKGDWSKTWWKADRLGAFQPNKEKGPAPRKEQAQAAGKRSVKIRVKV